MRAVLQRVSSARVSVAKETVGEIGRGMLVLLGVSVKDNEADAINVLDKIVNLRIFDDTDGKMNESLLDVSGEMLVISLFTLFGDSRRGRRPSYIDAARPEEANRLYKLFVAEARKKVSKVETGRFQAMMDVELLNDGPVTLLIDSEKTF